MGRPIYVHEEEEEATKKVDQECRTWRSFARRLERQPYVLRDIAPTLDASEPSDSQTRETGVASQTSESGELPDFMMAPPLSDSEGEWEALGASPYTPLQAGGTTRSVMVRRSLSPDVPRSHPVAWEPNNTITPPAPSVMTAGRPPQARPYLRFGADESLPEWPSPSQRTRRARRAALPIDGAHVHGWTPPQHPSWAMDRPSSRRVPEMWHLMRRELMGTSVGRRATGDIPTMREAQDNGRSSTALEMARYAARDLLRQLDVRIAESQARNQFVRTELGRGQLQPPDSSLARLPSDAEVADMSVMYRPEP